MEEALRTVGSLPENNLSGSGLFFVPRLSLGAT